MVRADAVPASVEINEPAFSTWPTMPGSVYVSPTAMDLASTIRFASLALPALATILMLNVAGLALMFVTVNLSIITVCPVAAVYWVVWLFSAYFAGISSVSVTAMIFAYAMLVMTPLTTVTVNGSDVVNVPLAPPSNALGGGMSAGASSCA